MITSVEVRAAKDANGSVEIRWQHDVWLKAKIERVYDNGADVIPFREDGSSPGLHYVLFTDMRLVA